MIIAFYGFSKAGKDTIVNELLKENKNSKRIAFADNPKRILCNSLGISLESFENLKDKHISCEYIKENSVFKIDNTFRDILIGIAESFKELDKNVWVKKSLQEIQEVGKSKNLFLISDLRFEHEYNYLKDNYDEIKFIKILGGTRINEDVLDDSYFDLVIDNKSKEKEKLENFISEIKSLID